MTPDPAAPRKEPEERHRARARDVLTRIEHKSWREVWAAPVFGSDPALYAPPEPPATLVNESDVDSLASAFAAFEREVLERAAQTVESFKQKPYPHVECPCSGCHYVAVRNGGLDLAAAALRAGAAPAEQEEETRG